MNKNMCDVVWASEKKQKKQEKINIIATLNLRVHRVKLSCIIYIGWGIHARVCIPTMTFEIWITKALEIL